MSHMFACVTFTNYMLLCDSMFAKLFMHAKNKTCFCQLVIVQNLFLNRENFTSIIPTA